MIQLELFPENVIHERAVKIATACFERGHMGFIPQGFDWTVEHIKSCIDPEGDGSCIVYFRVAPDDGYIHEIDEEEDVL